MSIFFIFIATLLSIGYARSEQPHPPHRMRSLRDLLATERILIENFHKYGKALNEKLALVKRAIKGMEDGQPWPPETYEEYLENPVNAFKLIRRLQMDWKRWMAFMKKPIREEAINKIKEHCSNLPTSTDLTMAINEIHHLTSEYELQVLDITRGLLNGEQYDVSLSTLDCATMGFELFSQAKYNESKPWLTASTMSYEKSDIIDLMDFTKVKLLNALKKTFLHLSLPKKANEMSLMIFKEEFRLYNSDISPDEVFSEIPSTPIDIMHKRSREIFARCCRGEFSNRLSRFHCLYNTTTTPFLKLAPLKMEIIHLDPYIVLFHDVIYENEIDEFKKRTRPNLEPAKIFGFLKQKDVNLIRPAKQCWIKDETLNISIRINRRISDMTGLDTEGSENLQVINYGLGGYYDLHYDFIPSQPQKSPIIKNGDRIATVIFYLSDVEQGGFTVFPYIDKAIAPKKGTALMWYNMNNYMMLHPLTYHAACPVVVGSKWVMSKWIHDRNQMFRKLCYP